MQDKFKLIAGPCVIENKENVFKIAEKMKEITEKHNINYFFKASFDKANRSSSTSFRGPGLREGLKILKEVKEKFDLKILTDIHETNQVQEVIEVVDILQIPAFLCRQTDLILKVAESIKNTDKIANVKKGQFLAPWDMKEVVKKFKESGISPDSGQLWLTERGSSFGYNTLVVDYRSIPQLKETGCPVIFDATHSVQQPGGKGSSSGGQREFVAPLARAAMAVGIDGLFMETHPDPENALSDGPNMVPLYRVEQLLISLLGIRESIGTNPPPSNI